MPAKKSTPAKKSSARKLVPSRTKVSRNARRIRREFFARQAEHLFFVEHPTDGTPAEIERAARRFAAIEAQFNKLPVLAQKLEVSAKLALAEMEGDDEGEE